MGKYQRAKGARAEREVVNLLRAAGIAAERVPLSGASHFKGEGHDITIHDGVKAEVKIRKDDFKRLYEWLQDNDMVIFRRDHDEWLVTMTLADWMKGGHR